MSRQTPTQSYRTVHNKAPEHLRKKALEDAAVLIKETAEKTDFKESELVPQVHWDKKEQRCRVGVYPVIAGRIRLAHEDHQGEGDDLAMGSELINYSRSAALAKACVETKKGKFSAHGESDVEKDFRFKGNLIGLAETRALARALQRAGYGIEFRSAEEMEGVDVIGDDDQAEVEPTKEEQDREEGVQRAAARPTQTHRANGKTQQPTSQGTSKANGNQVQVASTGNKCEDCGETVMASIAKLSMDRHGRILCTTHFPSTKKKE